MFCDAVSNAYLFRCEKWIKYSDNPTFKDMEDKKLRNRNVCEEHFRFKMFMNIRKERLVRFAIPTLMKTKSNGKVYDLQKMEDCCEIENLNAFSELDDYFDQFLVEDSENPTLVGLQQPVTEVVREPSSFTLNEQNIGEIPVEFQSEKEPPEVVKVLPKKIILTPVRKKVMKRPAISESSELGPGPVKMMKTVKILNSSNLMKTVTAEPIEIQTLMSSNKILLKQEPEGRDKSPQQQKEVFDMIEKIKEERENAILNEKKAKQNLNESQVKITLLELKVQELEKKLKLAEAIKSKPAKALTVSVSVQTDPEPKVVPKVQTSPNGQAQAKPGTLSKPQLFNGIKRYLSNAMATLLKMEMFGNSEREWKADEKKISCEVMRLGKDVYEYFTDEWRLRLPSKSEVSNWMQDNADDEEEDLF